MGYVGNRDISREAAVLSQVQRESSVYKSVSATQPLDATVYLWGWTGLALPPAHSREHEKQTSSKA